MPDRLFETIFVEFFRRILTSRVICDNIQVTALFDGGGVTRNVKDRHVSKRPTVDT